MTDNTTTTRLDRYLAMLEILTDARQVLARMAIEDMEHHILTRQS